MKISFTHHIHKVLAVAIVGLLFGATYFANPSFVKTQEAQAGTGENLSGFAWGENIGWISFNSTSDGSAESYGVNVDTSTKVAGGVGVFSGFAWSENIGWVSFNQSDITGICPAGATVARIDWPTGKVSGWARAISGSTTSGWDGCIKFSNNGNAWMGSGAYDGVAIDINTVNFSGYAWGSDVVGWIDFAPTVDGEIIPNSVRIGPPTPSDAVIVTATVNGAPSASVVSGGMFTLRMNSVNATSCTVVRTSVNNNLGDDADASGASSLNINYTSAWAGPTTVTWAYTCTGSGGTSTDSATLTISGSTTSGPAVSIYANPETITLGESSNIIWASSGATSCTATGGMGGDGWAGPKATEGTQSVSPTADVTYSISCTDGSTSAGDSTPVNVIATTPYVTIFNTNQGDGTYNITWLTGNFPPSSTVSCVAPWTPSTAASGVKVVTPSSGINYYPITCTDGTTLVSGSTTITIGTPSCNNDGVCQPSNNENTVSCPHDCADFGGTGTR